jgi:hypothetical protein
MLETEPVALAMVLMRTPLSELEILEFVILTFLTTLLERPPTEPIERPWPPEQSPLVKVMLVPELMAMQSSWFLTMAPEMKMFSAFPMLKPSVLWPPLESPAEESRVTS